MIINYNQCYETREQSGMRENDTVAKLIFLKIKSEPP